MSTQCVICAAELADTAYACVRCDERLSRKRGMSNPRRYTPADEAQIRHELTETAIFTPDRDIPEDEMRDIRNAFATMRRPPAASEALIVHPGDVLLVRLPLDTTHAEADQVKETLKARLPDVEVAIILGAEQLAAYRPAPPDDGRS